MRRVGCLIDKPDPEFTCSPACYVSQCVNLPKAAQPEPLGVFGESVVEVVLKFGSSCESMPKAAQPEFLGTYGLVGDCLEEDEGDVLPIALATAAHSVVALKFFRDAAALFSAHAEGCGVRAAFDMASSVTLTIEHEGDLIDAVCDDMGISDVLDGFPEDILGMACGLMKP